MIIIPRSWLKVVLFPLWPFALLYWWRASRQGFRPDWYAFDVWAGRAWWSVVAAAVFAGAIAGAFH